MESKEGEEDDIYKLPTEEKKEMLDDLYERIKKRSEKMAECICKIGED